MNSKNYAKLMDEELGKSEARDKTLVLHACCAPCSSHCLTVLQDKIKIKVYYYNPNITDRAEFDKRSAELERLVEILSAEYPGAFIEFIGSDYDPESFLEISKGLEKEHEGGARCAKCFELRLRAAARLAKSEGADYFTTTLTISPLKDAKLINEIGERIAAEEGIAFLPSDFKKKEGYKHSVELSHKYGLYRQDYCGCAFSKAESLQRKELHEKDT
ncbi:MAG: epoxyqueuosine reductase QueH [Lachnospiraceae bacterium]|nr:epoxyqueuosine reductase QueH [Lachnospiraceae bacterium]